MFYLRQTKGTKSYVAKLCEIFNRTNICGIYEPNRENAKNS